MNAEYPQQARLVADGIDPCEWTRTPFGGSMPCTNSPPLTRSRLA